LSQETSSTLIPELNSTTFKEKVWDYNSSVRFKCNSKVPIILEFYATWCSPCKRFAPNLQAIQQKYSNLLYIYRINVDNEPEISKLFSIKNLPTLVFVSNQSIYKTEMGYKEITELEELVKKYFNGIN